MDLVKRQPGFIYLDKNGFYFFEDGLNSVISLAFSSMSVRDMDVINGASLISQIEGFIDQYKLQPATITIILSPNITFDKEFIDLGYEARKEEIEKFIDLVPFESVLSSEYSIPKGVKVVAGNDDLYTEVKAGFEKRDFLIVNIVPYQMLGQDQNYIKNLTFENATEFLKRIDHLKQFSMLKTETEKIQKIISTDNKKLDSVPSKKLNIRLFAMIGVFAVLFVILGVMIINM